MTAPTTSAPATPTPTPSFSPTATATATVPSSSSTIPTPAISHLSPRGTSESSTRESKGLFLKSKTKQHKSNGQQTGNWVVLTPPLATKKLCWADQVEEEEELMQLAVQPKQMAPTSLKTGVFVKGERVKELEATLATRALRIAELHSTLQDRDAYIEVLENDLKRKDDEIEELQKKNHVQYVEIQELHCEVSEKDNHIKGTKAELEQVPSTQKIRFPVPHSDSSTKSDDTKVFPASFEAVKTPEAELALPKTPQSTKSESAIYTQQTEAIRGPTFSDTTSPIFVTKETLKEVSPVPKPKKLTFPIDLSKYGKQPTKSPTASPAAKLSPASKTIRSGHMTSWSESPKQLRIKTDVKPTFKPSADIRKMTSSQRALFANGPDVTVKLGDIELKTLPQYILMQCSGKALDYFSANPKATSWSFPEGSMDADIAKSVLNWMHEMTYQNRVYSITLNTSPQKDEKNLQICRAARVLGLTNCYIGHFTKLFCDRIRSKDMSYATMSNICKYALPEGDSILDCLTHNLVNMKLQGSAEDKAVGEKLTAEYPAFKAKMDTIEKKTRATEKRK